MARFVADVPTRWVDQDAYRHVNHAAIVTLLEEARIGLVFTRAQADGVESFGQGLIVVGLHVDYLRQITYRPVPLRVELWVEELRAASFRICYHVHDGPDTSRPVAVRAWTRMATFDFETQRPRRLTPAERAFLERWQDSA